LAATCATPTRSPARRPPPDDRRACCLPRTDADTGEFSHSECLDLVRPARGRGAGAAVLDTRTCDEDAGRQCPAPRGPCCLADAPAEVVKRVLAAGLPLCLGRRTRAERDRGLGGRWLFGDAASCDDVDDCDEPGSACCLREGGSECSLTAAECRARGGRAVPFAGCPLPDDVCPPEPDPVGACCLRAARGGIIDARCVHSTRAQCARLDGEWTEDERCAAAIATGDCPAPPALGRSCADRTTKERCITAVGSWAAGARYGDDPPCFEPRGACCSPSQARCFDNVTESTCEERLDGRWFESRRCEALAEDGTPTETGSCCVPPCAARWRACASGPWTPTTASACACASTASPYRCATTRACFVLC